MLEKLITVKSVGLLADISSVKFGRTTLVYGENGKGKSTLAWLLRVSAKSDAAQMPAKRSLQKELSQEVAILFDTPSGKRTSMYKDGTWNSAFESIEVFDSIFIDENVYAGMAVDPKQRQQLLDFVLGDAPVEIKKQLEALDTLSRKHSNDKTNAESALKGYADPMAVPAYVKASIPPNLDGQLSKAQQVLQDLSNAEAILKRSKPTAIKDQDFYLIELKELLGTTLEDLEKNAEAKLRNHIGTRDHKMEPWLHEGLGYCIDTVCPFCGKDASDSDMISAYRSYFNEEYIRFKDRLSDLASRIRSKTQEAKLEAAFDHIRINNEYIRGWSPQVKLDTIEFPEAALAGEFRMLRTSTEVLLTQKLNSPLEAVRGDELDTAMNASQSICSILTKYRNDVSARLLSISEFEKSLAKGDVRKQDLEVRRLRALKNRSQDVVASYVTQYTNASAAYTETNKQKATLQRELRDLAPTVISPYAEAINELLNSFGANFEIKGVEQRNDGGRPTVVYGLKLFGKEVQLGTRESAKSAPSFGSTLSDGDKRTLALAFFIAKIRSDPKLGEKIIVIDDPMSSFDRNRQRRTVDLLCELSQRSRQLVVLSHDARFLESVRKRVAARVPKGQTADICELQICRCSDGSKIESCSLGRLSLQGFPAKRSMLVDFLNGKSTDVLGAVHLIREVVESFLKLKYPEDISIDSTLGDIIYSVDCYSDTAKNNISRHIESLKRINESTKPLHHGGNLEEQEGITDSEAKTLGELALRTIASGL